MNLFHRKTLFLYVFRNNFYRHVLKMYRFLLLRNQKSSSIVNIIKIFRNLFLPKARHLSFIFFFLPPPPSSSFFFLYHSSDHSKQVNHVQLVPEFQRYVRAHSNDACAMMMIACHVTGLRLCNSQQRQSHLISSLLAVA